MAETSVGLQILIVMSKNVLIACLSVERVPYVNLQYTVYLCTQAKVTLWVEQLATVS